MIKFLLICYSTIFIILFILPSAVENGTAIQGTFHLPKPNICYRCDNVNGGKKVKKCPKDFNRPESKKVEVIECGYQKSICGITVNVSSDQPTVIYAGCYSKKFNRHCFKDRVWQYGPESDYCYHTCTEFFCNPYDSWLKGEKAGFNLFNLLG